MVELLLNDKKVDFNAQDDEGMLPVMVAVKNGFTDIAELFLRSDFSARIYWNLCDQRGFTCLFWAATSDFEDLVSLLLKQSEIVQGIDKPGARHSPLASAARKGYVQIVIALLDHSATPDAKDDREGRAALSWAAGNGHEDVVDRLLRCEDIDINHADRRLKWTAFQWAAAQKQGAIAWKILHETLERLGNRWRDYISTLFLDVAKRGQYEALNILLELHDFDPDFRDRDSQRTALSFAAEHGHVRIVQRLLSSGRVNVNAGDVGRKTALMWTADQGRSSVVKELLAREELDILAVDSEERCACDWAQASNHLDVQRLIEDRQHRVVHRSRSRQSSGTS
ncbi:uncharacterized protein A1O5_01095 [Cladophialophora psammophila CBS 110553]|uniref:Uncharacterized protein n=1 Tax=Cladophialophora psammophila CBS 110553 TaxID=1182543 RepID=W9X7Y1_9EURO|nr:uncharacterized protein A1O5_01095 [Cladophialophora psammophila CBS 110553]EXJ76587.1 hypothetical protein A1O5_01095 [Cladophialophora psammophila CBS 110553]